ncbi:hypothetical protein HanRHA438_Chr02g0093261 [Helianthus annuus]|nr:hypothetical protein HanRHA438_Chr02g0093261 [Helianthus annuus]
MLEPLNALQFFIRSIPKVPNLKLAWPKHLRSQRKCHERSSSSCMRRFLQIGMQGLKKSIRVVRRKKLPL